MTVRASQATISQSVSTLKEKTASTSLRVSFQAWDMNGWSNLNESYRTLDQPPLYAADVIPSPGGRKDEDAIGNSAVEPDPLALRYQISQYATTSFLALRTQNPFHHGCSIVGSKAKVQCYGCGVQR
ncbi:hypothetical protein E4U19_004445 [Claviceps sp. Clav32 group G5]|nr:hypothetical protein E4U19_004445 [Claviceps sp. Clav32 group G5]